MPNDKNLIREKMLSIRKNMSKNEVEEKSARIIYFARKFITQEVNSIMFYVPINNEVDLIPLAEELFEKEYEILFPKVMDKTVILPYIINNFFKDFKKGAYGIPEPNTKAYKKKIDICFVPGIAFGSNGFRVGYGYSYFDRFLFSGQVHKTIGIGYDFQFVESVPYDKYDYKLDYLITEKGMGVLDE